MDFEPGGYYRYTEPNGNRWLVQCMYANADKTALRLVDSVDEVFDVVSEVDNKEIKKVIKNGHKFELLDNKTEIAKVLLNGL